MRRGEIADHCSLIGLKDADFNSQFISNAKRLFSETLSPKNHGQVCLDRKGYQYELLVSFTLTTSAISAATHTDEQLSYMYSKLQKGFPTK